MIVHCLKCSKWFYIKPSHWKNGDGKYCSLKCYRRRKLTGKMVACAQCKKKFYARPKQLNGSISGRCFCTKSCYLSFQIFDKHPRWENGVNAYLRLMKAKKTQVCTLCGIKKTRVLIVHHIDRDRKNNALSNLTWLCRNCHFLVHHYKKEVVKLMVPMV